MGKAIEQIALKHGHTIVLKIHRSNLKEFNEENLQAVDVAIEFTQPDAALENVLKCLRAGVPVVCGTTGWDNRKYEAEEKAVENNTAFLQTSNFSVGVNIFFEINKQLAMLMNRYPEYDVRIEETHHTQKKDAPSGTAITLANQILDYLDRKDHWVKGTDDVASHLDVIAHRIPDVPGTHEVYYTSAIDDIEIRHTAHSRDGFATGAVLAAEFLKGRKGIFTMHDVLFGGEGAHI